MSGVLGAAVEVAIILGQEVDVVEYEAGEVVHPESLPEADVEQQGPVEVDPLLLHTEE